MKIKKAKNSDILILAIITLFAIAFTGKIIYDIKTISNNIYNKRVALEKKYFQGQSLGKTVKEARKSSDRLEQIDKLLISSEKILTMVSDLEQLAESLDLKQTIRLTEPSSSGKIIPVPLAINLEGNYINILKYINALDRKEYYINTYRLNFSGQNFISPNKFVTLQLNANIHWN